MISMLFYCLAQACSITEGVLLVYCVLTWFVSPASRVMQILSGIIDPMLMPIRRFLMRFTGSIGLDFSPFILLLALQALQSLFLRLAWMM